MTSRIVGNNRVTSSWRIFSNLVIFGSAELRNAFLAKYPSDISEKRARRAFWRYFKVMFHYSGCLPTTHVVRKKEKRRRKVQTTTYIFNARGWKAGAEIGWKDWSKWSSCFSFCAFFAVPRLSLTLFLSGTTRASHKFLLLSAGWSSIVN